MTEPTAIVVERVDDRRVTIHVALSRGVVKSAEDLHSGGPVMLAVCGLILQVVARDAPGQLAEAARSALKEIEDAVDRAMEP